MDERTEIKNRLEIAEVVSTYLPLKQSGRNLKAPCPFHQEKSASFTVSPEKGIYHCFGCNEGGDIFSFVMKMEGLEFREALEKLARQAGIELKAKRGEDVGASKHKARLFEAHQLAVRYFQASLVQNPAAIEYVVKKRHLKRETVQDFQIGYAPDSWNALTDFLNKKGFTNSELLDAGLAGQKEGRNTIYDLFRGRVTFTIADRDGRPIGFTARVLDDGLPKYLNTPQTKLYDKSNAIFGLHLAREAIRAKDEVVLVEGNMDVVASHQAGVKQVVATSGTALTLDQLRTLSKLTKNIKLAFDSDRAGLAATERAIELGQKLGLTLRMVVINDAKDADELISQNPQSWSDAIADAKYIIDYLFDRFEADFDLTTAIGKKQYTDRLAYNLRRLGDPVEQGHYIRLLAKRVGVDEDDVRAKLEQGDEPPRQQVREHGARSNPNQSSVTTKSAPTGDVDDGRWSQPSIQNQDSNDNDTAPRARILANQKPTIRTQLEESVLSLALMYPITRVSLNDLSQAEFDSSDRKAIFNYMLEHSDMFGSDIARSLTQCTDYVNILLLRGEQQFAEVAPADRSFEGFELGRRLQIASNKDIKQVIQTQLREAQAKGDIERELILLTQLQSIITQEV